MVNVHYTCTVVCSISALCFYKNVDVTYSMLFIIKHLINTKKRFLLPLDNTPHTPAVWELSSLGLVLIMLFLK